MSLDSRDLDAATVYRFRLRLALGTPSSVAPPRSVREVVAGIRHAIGRLAARAEEVAATAEHLGERGWRTLSDAPTGRDVLATHGFAVPDGTTLPEEVGLAREASAREVAADLAGAGPLAGELEESLTVRVEGLDIPVRLRPAPELRYSPREFLETFSVRT
jgi:hypothetical protein